ncbi:MAG: division/cell wall cluster transcriptional repressor MraZ [Anaerolineaceae bacterium]|jgi:MraZ protein|nr:division/cell wall cluster transcriptional repressor MraZ [Anaerolineaceae bacterium]
MFLGQFVHAIDDKGRLTIPAGFRGLLDDGAYITQGFDPNLMVLTYPSFQTLYDRVNKLSMTDPKARDLKRLIFANAAEVKLDNAGRILIPQFLREVASLDNNALVVGVGKHFEIWSPGLWSQETQTLHDPAANAERFIDLDLPL